MAMFGLPNKRAQYCDTHYVRNVMVNVVLESKCDTIDCDATYDVIIEDVKYCFHHCPESEYKHSINKVCKYCDITSQSQYICKDCKKLANKTEWGIVQYIRQNIDSNFIYNSSKIFNGLSNKRPDLFIELLTHYIIIEIDEHQHKSYKCECARSAEIVGCLGTIRTKPVIFIRFNPDKIKHKNKILKIDMKTRANKLVEIIKSELDKIYDKFGVTLIQLYYDDTYDEYCDVKIQDITDDIVY
jgi:hypothetical protein